MTRTAWLCGPCLDKRIGKVEYFTIPSVMCSTCMICGETVGEPHLVSLPDDVGQREEDLAALREIVDLLNDLYLAVAEDLGGM